MNTIHHNHDTRTLLGIAVIFLLVLSGCSSNARNDLSFIDQYSYQSYTVGANKDIDSLIGLIDEQMYVTSKYKNSKYYIIEASNSQDQYGYKTHINYSIMRDGVDEYQDCVVKSANDCTYFNLGRSEIIMVDAPEHNILIIYRYK